MRAYIARAWGVKEGIDFDRVESELIHPALELCDLSSIAASEVMGAGDLREDALQQLITADVVVADVSVARPSTFYELGIRHALRERHTILLRAKTTPARWYLSTSRMVLYDPDQPAASLDFLVRDIRNSLSTRLTDSPVYISIPALPPPRIETLQALPFTFREELDRAKQNRRAGDLALLAQEVQVMPWRMAALRLIGKTQVEIRDFQGASRVWSSVRDSQPDDIEANSMLALVYQRLRMTTESRLAIERVLRSREVTAHQRAEALNLQGRDLKEEWVVTWRGLEASRPQRALGTPLLHTCRDAYLAAFREDLNHWYSGLNALAMTFVLCELARKAPEVWADRFETDEEASVALAKETRRAAAIASAVDFAIAAARDRNERQGSRDIWLDISEADLLFVTTRQPSRLPARYERVLAGAPSFAADAVRSQIALFADLGVFEDRSELVLKAIGGLVTPVQPAQPPRNVRQVLLFTGHDIDSPGQLQPRVPPARAQLAFEAIREAVEQEVQEPASAIGLAGGSSGGDILFHEACAEIGVPTCLYLAIPEHQYMQGGVAPAGIDWVARFDRIKSSSPVAVLQSGLEMPEWLRPRPDYDVWQRNNLWLLNNALAYPETTVTLIALWNGEDSYTKGGVSDMVAQARKAGAKVLILNPEALDMK